jgi:hypothetical protein
MNDEIVKELTRLRDRQRALYDATPAEERGRRAFDTGAIWAFNYAITIAVFTEGSN